MFKYVIIKKKINKCGIINKRKVISDDIILGRIVNKILVVDDEIRIRELIIKYANHENIMCDEASNGEEAIKLVKKNEYDLIIMDIMMPILDGFSASKIIRRDYNMPIIMLSARSEEYDKIYGFYLGIDDYVTKPFSPKELMMRVKAVINRYQVQKEKTNIIKSTFIYQDLLIDFDGHLVTIDKQKIDLTNKEYELLVYLVQNVSVALTREQLIIKCWGSDFDKDDRTLDTHIKSLRKKIGKYGDNIITIRRVGYRFEIR